MKEFLFFTNSTVGVINRKALQAAGMTFRVSDIPVIYAAAAGYDG